MFHQQIFIHFSSTKINYTGKRKSPTKWSISFAAMLVQDVAE